MASHIKTIIRLRYSFAWWVKPYIYALWAFCTITGLRPDTDKVAETVMRGFKIEVVRG